MSQVLEFVGEPFDAVAWLDAGLPAAGDSLPALSERSETPLGLASPAAYAGASAPVLARLRTTLVTAHSRALALQTALQLRQLARRAPIGAPGLPEPRVIVGVGDVPTFKPLAFSTVNRLGPAELARLAAGEIAGVFGAAYDQEGCNPDLRVADGAELALAQVLAMRYLGYGRAWLQVRCTPGADLVEAAAQAGQVFALYLGLHLCFADATFVRLDQDETRIEPGVDGTGADLEIEVEEIDLIPRPWLRVRARLGNTGTAVTVVVAVQEKPGVPVGPAAGGLPTRWLGRKSALGERVVLNEFHMTHLSRGDQGIAFGPEYAHYTGGKATRLPSGGLMLVDRLVEVEGERGRVDSGAWVTEYDSHADAWYYADSANDSMPNCVLVETASQASLLTGYYLGATLPTPDAPLSLRQLSGSTTVLKEIDLRDTTIRQRSELVDTSVAGGSIIQSFTHVLSVRGEPFYAGETMFGYFGAEALAVSAGLDGGKVVPTWLESERPSGARVIDVAARRADPGARLCSRNHLALVDQLTVVDGGGRYGKGYLHAQRSIDPDYWLFNWHFPFDPVMPGSFGQESIIQAMQEWLLDTDEARSLRDPGFVLPVGVPMVWKYRGQFEPTDEMATLEVHVKDVQTRPGRVRAIADASMWKPGLRIYQLTDVAVELREKDAQPW